VDENAEKVLQGVRVNYSDLLARKLALTPPTGIDRVPAMPEYLFPHQAALVTWGLRRGRCAIFADTGLGKTRMELVWADKVARHEAKNALILAPLAVAEQTVREGASVGINVTHIRDDSDFRSGLNIVNYERLHKIDPERYGAVVLDESSIIKHHDAKTLRVLMEAFGRTPFKLCATATPAPNDWTELGTHAEFLGICSRAEMLSEFFIHDGAETQVWRLKGHAKHEFWRWVSSWGAMVRWPSDLGFEDAAYRLPKLEVQEHTVETIGADTNGMLFKLEALTLSDRRSARKESITQRVQACAAMVNADRQPWVVWCDLNAESEALTRAIDGAVEVRGSQSVEEKEGALQAFAAGQHRVIVTKPSIAGHGLNWQHCARMAFVGVTDSYESYYQAVRRCWRFGQKRPVQVHVFASEGEGAVVANLRRKEADAAAMSAALSAETREAVRANVLGVSRQSNPYEPKRAIAAPNWLRSIA
jgi:hypothetical protein